MSSLETLQDEQDATRLALMGDAVCIAASSIYFTVRLLDSTVDLFFTSFSLDKFRAFLEFKHSEELANLTFSLVYPLVFMRLFGSVKDMYFSFCKNEGDDTRRAVDLIDLIVLSLACMWTFGVIPPLERKMLAGSRENFDSLAFAHLLALAQAGLLALLSLFKLFARLERSAVKFTMLLSPAAAARLTVQRGEESVVVVEEEEIEEVDGSLIAVEQKRVVTMEELLPQQQQPPQAMWKRVEMEEVDLNQALEELEELEEDNFPLWVGLAAGVASFALTFKFF